MFRYSLIALLLSAATVFLSGCSSPVVAEPPPSSPVVERDPRISAFRTAVRKFSEEARVAANRLELGMCRSDAEILLDDLKNACSRVPEAPRPEFLAQRAECIAVVKQLEETAVRLFVIDAEKRKIERLARLAPAQLPVVEVAGPEWVAPEERQIETRTWLVELDDRRGEILRQGIADARLLNAQLKASVEPRAPLAAREPDPTATIVR